MIGSGIGGLSAAALLAHNGKSVCVCESHDAAGGAAHEWTVKGFHFESGPSLYAGLSPRNTPNPLAHVFHIIGEVGGTLSTIGGSLKPKSSKIVVYFMLCLRIHSGDTVYSEHL